MLADPCMQSRGAKKTMPPKRRTPVTQAQAREWALALPEVIESSHMGRPDLRVRKKIFATLPPDGKSVNLKCSPSSLDALVRSDSVTFRDVWQGRWVGVSLTTVEAQELNDLLTDAWRLVAPVALSRKLVNHADSA